MTITFVKSFQADHYDFVPLTNHSGGIAILWNNGNIYASVLLKE